MFANQNKIKKAQVFRDIRSELAHVERRIRVVRIEINNASTPERREELHGELQALNRRLREVWSDRRLERGDIPKRRRLF